MRYLKYSAIIVMALFLSPVAALAHQPRINDSRFTEVSVPEVSKAYYGRLAGEPDVYIIRASAPFDLYVNILIPDIAGQKKDVSVGILKDDIEFTKLDGINFNWEKFYEPIGADTYWMGPEYKARAEAGIYQIRVSSPNNDSKYALAIGEIEAFDLKEGLNAFTLIPELKRSFFNESPISFIASPLGWGLVVSMYFFAGIVVLVCRLISKRVTKKTVRGLHKNIGTVDRLMRLVIGMGLLLWAITTTWNPIIIFFSGFVVLEAIFSWCFGQVSLIKKPAGIDRGGILK